MGWALKTVKPRPRLGEKVKAFFIEKSERGERSGNKADPMSVSREMKFKKDDKGKLLFEPEEWKTTQQIKSFFSRYSTKLRQQQMGELKDTEPEVGVEEELPEENMEAWESEITLQELRLAVFNETKKPEHPIEVEGVNGCQMFQDGKLKTLKVSQLRAIWDTLGLTIEGSQARKKSFIEPLEELVKTCSCQQ
jgi:hypothetical protein